MIKTVIFDIDNTMYNHAKVNTVAFGTLTEYVDQNFGLISEIFEELHKETYQDQKNIWAMWRLCTIV